MANEQQSNRGLASADEKTRREVASKGGSAPHAKRGLQASDEETKKKSCSSWWASITFWWKTFK